MALNSALPFILPHCHHKVFYFPYIILGIYGAFGGVNPALILVSDSILLVVVVCRCFVCS
jgi:hypothetical protein